MPILYAIPTLLSRKRTQEVRSTMLRVFSMTPQDVAAKLRGFDEKDWQGSLRWLHTSGLALYMFDHLTRLQMAELIPDGIRRGLQRNYVQNSARNAGLLVETAEVNQEFQREGILFANLKGITLSPESVLDPSLRCQLDLDFMVLAEHAQAAARVLEGMGYRLSAVSGSSWEFKCGHSRLPSFEDLYKAKPQRCAELHLVCDDGLLRRVERRVVSGVMVAALPPLDVYFGQACHLFKHLCSPFTRASWLLELRQHTEARKNDVTFWSQIEERVASDAESRAALAFASSMLSLVFEEELPPLLAKLVVTSISRPQQLWLRSYGEAALMADFPGTKLYRLLAQGTAPSLSRGTRRFPKLPMPVTQGFRGEGLHSKIGRLWIEASYVGSRASFHLGQGLRYHVEASRFRALLAEQVP